MKQLGLMKVNTTFKLGDVSENLRRFILENGYEFTKHFVETAQLNGYYTRDLWNKDTELGLRVYRDYFICVDLVYPAYDRNTGEVGHCTLEIGRYNRYSKTISSCGIENNWNVIDWLKENDVNIDDLFKEITELMNGDFEIVEDYDYEELMDALECGRTDLAWEIVGDRDLMEVL